MTQKENKLKGNPKFVILDKHRSQEPIQVETLELAEKEATPK